MRDFEKECEEYLLYLTEIASYKYSDCPDVEELIQESLMSYVVKVGRGEEITHPKAFLQATLKNRYNMYLRSKYRDSISVYGMEDVLVADDEFLKREEAEAQKSEYESVRREIGRLSKIFREVTVRYYIKGHSVNQIATDLGISEGTVKSRLSIARGRIKGKFENMEKYSNLTFEPKKVRIGVWGNDGVNGEPFSLIGSDIEGNILYTAYEKPIAVSDIADTLGMPCVFVEGIVDKLVNGELMGRTESGLVYTRCYMIPFEESFGDIDAQEKCAEKYASAIWDIVSRNIGWLSEEHEFCEMNDKQKATLFLLLTHLSVIDVVRKTNPAKIKIPELPERPKGGKWLATVTVFSGSPTRWQYDVSGPCFIRITDKDKKTICTMNDFQSVFGDTHWAYPTFKYPLKPQSALKLYAYLIPESGFERPEWFVDELVEEFEKLYIVKRREDGSLALDIPFITSDLADKLEKSTGKIADEIFALLENELVALWKKCKRNVPAHVDGREHYIYNGEMKAFSIAVLKRFVNCSLLPYPVEIGKTPLILVCYKKKSE